MVPLRVGAPIVAAFLLFLGIAASSARRSAAPRPAPAVGAGRPPPFRHAVTTAAGGYVVFLLIVLVFHVVIAGQREAMASALTGGALLAFAVAVPVFALLSWIEGAVHRRLRDGRSRRSG